jgi:hypothetical protein
MLAMSMVLFAPFVAGKGEKVTAEEANKVTAGRTLKPINPDLKKFTAGSPQKFVSTFGAANATLSAKTKNNGWVEYKQCDYPWGSQMLGWCSGLSICDAGCAMTSATMLLATKGIAVDPGSLDNWLSYNGGYWDGCDLIWATIDAFGVTSFQGMETADEEAICNGLAAGHGIIANVMNGGHWVLLTGCLGGGVFTVNDPGFSRDTYGIWEIVMEAVYH